MSQPPPSKPSRALEIQLNLSELGLPGISMHLAAIGRSKSNPNAACNAAHPAGSPGQYKVTFVLSRPGFSLEPEYKFSFAHLLKGDSHLAIAKPAVTNPQGDFDQIQIDGVPRTDNSGLQDHPTRAGTWPVLSLIHFTPVLSATLNRKHIVPWCPL